MTEPTAAVVAAMLADAGLTHDVFDAEEVAADLRERTAMNETLDELLDEQPRRDPTAFEARWR